ncbi:hypothetical protein PAXRUDRAFT_162942 [Paxillus rubicundulus Ve08.2h10]|uniref:Uncharacterized protein n=1 Tax=Paxillus rubicundulus Ve08.2h10 TaxID=930991 RepID=A0A0D0CTT6_9AGAM|nr:hypothetical protein PAXRUDRAFT_162942 [Paxillus rubicundulus Ve08.2h10]
MNCGKEKLILGLPWLYHTNPTINWAANTLDPEQCLAKMIQKKLDPMVRDFRKSTLATKLAQKDAETQKEKHTLPPEFSEFAEVFEKKATDYVPLT